MVTKNKKLSQIWKIKDQEVKQEELKVKEKKTKVFNCENVLLHGWPSCIKDHVY